MTREKLLNQIAAYIPYNEQEAADRELILHWIQDHDDAFTRQNKVAHITASAWVVNRDRRKVLLVYHNIYNSWSWLGGHADGETDLLAVALREVKEEAGIAIVAMGRKGGSNVAAAICNALLYQAAEMLDPKARGWQ